MCNINEHEHIKEKNLLKSHLMALLNEAGEVEGVKLQAAGSSGTLRSSVSVGVSRVNEHQSARGDCIDE